jgi:hypothetical protein
MHYPADGCDSTVNMRGGLPTAVSYSKLTVGLLTKKLEILPDPGLGPDKGEPRPSNLLWDAILSTDVTRSTL